VIPDVRMLLPLASPPRRTEKADPPVFKLGPLSLLGEGLAWKPGGTGLNGER
jgi:hypothetical protein